MATFDARTAPAGLKDFSYPRSDGSIRVMRPNDSGNLVPRDAEDDAALELAGFTDRAAGASKPKATKRASKPRATKAAKKASLSADATVTPEAPTASTPIAETKGTD